MRKIGGVSAQLVTEGSARLWVPARSDFDPHHEEVFFNPVMRLNRSLSSLALGAAETVIPQKLAVCDGLCATGARGVRYALENPNVASVRFVEANPQAVSFIKKNVSLNKLSKKSKIVQDDLNNALAKTKTRLDWVEIDPFGSPVFFLESAIRRLHKTGILSVTSTDLANLVARPRLCQRMYEAKPMNNVLGHEVALRIVLGKLVRSLALYEFGAKPLACWYEGHYAKCVVLGEKSAPKADDSLEEIGYANYCPSCLNRWVSKQPAAVCTCGSTPIQWAGPLWTGKTSDSAFLEKMLSLNQKRKPADYLEIKEFLEILLGENDLPPLFYDSHELSRHLKTPAPRLNDLLERLQTARYRATRTHYKPTGFRTNAPLEVVKEKAK